VLPTDAAAPLTPEARAKAAAEYGKVAKALSALK
jgi:hypothetical protein